MITIKRLHSIVNADTPYEVYINGNLMGTVKDNESLSFNLRTSSNNKMYVKYKKVTSEVIEFDIDANQVKEYSIKTNKKETFIKDLIRKLTLKKYLEIKLEKDYYL